MIFGKRLARLLKDLRHDASSVQIWCCDVPSFAMSFAALRSQDRLYLVRIVRLSEGQDSVCTMLFDLFLNHIF